MTAEELLSTQARLVTAEADNRYLRAGLNRAVASRNMIAARFDRTAWTLRDLLRLAHRRGLYLSRCRTDGDAARTIHQVWQEPDGPRWVEVYHWPTRANEGPSWQLRINGVRRTEGSHKMLHAELWDPDVAEIVGALDWLGLLDAARPTDTRTTTQEDTDA
jgi:hypothetical protein